MPEITRSTTTTETPIAGNPIIDVQGEPVVSLPALAPAPGPVPADEITRRDLQTLSAQLAHRPSLAAALVRAVLACQPVSHDGRVQYGKTDYTYASSEAILREGRKALAEAGIALIPLEHSVNGHQREGPYRFELVRRFLLSHVSGESVAVGVTWPIIPQDGRPLDKATAAADTLSLSYFVRDLLLMPRVDPADEVAARNDSRQSASTSGRKPAPQQSARKGPEPAPANAERITEAQATELTALLVQAQANVAKFLEVYHVPVLVKLPAMHFEAAKRQLLQKIARNAQAAASEPQTGAPPAKAPQAPPPQTGAAAPAASPANGSGSPANVPLPDLIRSLHRQLEHAQKTWRSALLWAGVDLPEGYEDPADAEQAVFDLADCLPLERAQRIERMLQPRAARQKPPVPAGG